MKIRRYAVAAVVFGSLFTLPLVPAGTSGEARDRGRAILNRTAEFYAGIRSLSAVMEIRLEMPEGIPGMGKMAPERYRIALARPESVAVVADGEMPGATLIQDGERQYAAHAMFRRYVIRDSVPLEEMLRPEQSEAMAIPGLEIFLGLGLDSDAPGSLRGNPGVELLAEEVVDGVDCHHLGLGGSGSEGEVWIASGELPWVMRYRSDPPAPPEMPVMVEKPDSKPMLIQFEPGVDIRFRDWDIEPDLDGAFTIEPPEGYEQAETLFPPMEEMDELLGGLEGDHSSLGKPAPAARLAPLDGEPVDLSELRGKIVVLDFWATWCVPCIIELPLVDKVIEELAGRDVVLYAVNRGETEQTVRKFLAEREIDVPVVLDDGDSISAAFGVQALPHLVIIDREGTVQKVHIGSMTGSEERLRSEITSLLAESAADDPTETP